MFGNLLTSGVRTKAKTAMTRGGKRGFVPRLEALEEKWCPTCIVTTANGGRTINILGDNAANHVEVRQDDFTDSLVVTCDGVSQLFTSSTVTKINATLKDGDDYMVFGLGSSAVLKHGKIITMNLGKGNDGGGLDLLNTNGAGGGQLGAPLKVTVLGGQGNDAVGNAFGIITSNVTFKAQLGDGNDMFSNSFYGDILEGRLRFDVLGENGEDFMDSLAVTDGINFNVIDVERDAMLTLNWNGGAGNDVFRATHSGRIEGAIHIQARGGKGNDWLEVEEKAVPMTPSAVRVALLGDKGDDHFRFLGAGFSHNDSLAQALADGGAGTDTCMAWPLVMVRNCEL